MAKSLENRIWDRDRISVPKAILVGLTIVVVLALVVAASTSSASYGPYNSEWNGATDLRELARDSGTEVELGRETTSYSSVPPRETVALVLSPDSSYQPRELARITDFVRSGGTLVVAEDFGPHGNELLRTLGASSRFDGQPVRDVESNYRSSAMAVVTPASSHPLVAGVDSVTFNHGTIVVPAGGASSFDATPSSNATTSSNLSSSSNVTPLFNTSERAYLDTDRNGTLSTNETLGNYTVATVERVGNGRVIAIGDPSVFINTMLDRPGNRAFVQALLSRHGTLLLDYSHTGNLPPLVVAVLVVRESSALQFAIGGVAVGVLLVWSRRPGLLNRGKFASKIFPSILHWWRDDDSTPKDARATTSELTAYLERRHPDWDPERVERVVSAVERRRNR